MEVTTPGSGRMVLGEKQLSSSARWLAKLVCTVAVFTQCGMRTARGHPKGPILLHNNARKSMKGRSDKVEINQLVDAQGLAFNLRSNRETISKEMKQAVIFRIGFTSCFSPSAILPWVAPFTFYPNGFHHFFAARMYCLVRGMTPRWDLLDKQSRNCKQMFPYHNAYSFWWMEGTCSCQCCSASCSVKYSRLTKSRLHLKPFKVHVFSNITKD